MRNISARCGPLLNKQSLIKSPRAMIFTSCTLQINATLLFVVGRFPNLKVNQEKMTKFDLIMWRCNGNWSKREESELKEPLFFWERCLVHIWEYVLLGTRTSYRVTSLRITSCWPTNHSHGCFGQKPNVARWTNIFDLIFYLLRFRGLWKQTTTWSTISGSLELLLKLWNSRGDTNQVV